MARRTDTTGRAVDDALSRIDPMVDGVPASPGIDAAIDAITARIAAERRRTPRRASFTPRTVLALIAVIGLLAAGATAATKLFIPTRTRGPIMGHGVGDLINVDGTNFRQVALQVSSDLAYPPGFGSWRDTVAPFEYQDQQPACGPGPAPGCMPKMPTAQLHGAYAASTFCAWVASWRDDVLSGHAVPARRAAQVISGALSWAAIRAEDPHPRLSIPGDMGSTHPSPFGWMIPFIAAVRSGRVSNVNRAILRDGSYGGQFWVWTAVGLGLKRLPLDGDTVLRDLARGHR